MQLYSLQFLGFVVVALAAYYLVGRYVKRGQWVVLLVASLGFYLAAGWQNLFFIFLTSLSTWGVGLAFGKLDAACDAQRKQLKDRAEKKAVKQRFKHRKWLVLLGVMIVNFGVLGYIKYWNTLLGFVGAGDGVLASHLLLPLGISFYTFQSIGYTIDCYNGKTPPEKNYARFLLFVSFFPQLIQGPINRFDALGVQLYEHHSFDSYQARRALLLIGYGAFKKFAIADVLVNSVSHMLDFVDAGTPGSVIVFGVLLYTIQQYGDFSGGIDMVRGVSQLFGIEMAVNFRQPYFATSMADFWRRWHMSLGAWMRDYVFYPFAVCKPMLKLNKWGTEHLGKTFGRTLSACLGNILVFLLVGLWHGAETHYILWGLYNGIIIAAADVARPLFEWLNAKLKVNVESAGWHVWRILRTFALVNVGRVFDRLYDPQALATGWHNIVFNFNLGGFKTYLNLHPTFALTLCLVFAAVGCVLVFIVSVNKERGVDVTGKILEAPLVLRVLLYTFVFAMVVFSFTIAVQAGGFLYANF